MEVLLGARKTRVAGARVNPDAMEPKSQKARPVYGILPVDSLLLMVVRLVVA